MILFLMIYLGIGMTLTGAGMWFMGKEYGTFTNFVMKNITEKDYLSYYEKHPKLLEWSVYLLITIGWPYFFIIKS